MAAPGPALPNPELLDKYLYIRRTPTWYIRAFYGFGIGAWLLVALGFIGPMRSDPFYFWFVGPMLIFFTLYHVLTYGLACWYRRFDLVGHSAIVASFWCNTPEPTVDIFLPICGEDSVILENTWKHVSRIHYGKFNTYILDDSREKCAEHRTLALKYGFNYIERPNKGEMKKAGNLKYAYERTKGEFIVIFDADFAPRPDFLRELVPHMVNERVGIVQSPQYFLSSKEIHHRSPLEYGAAQVQEAFYRFIQPARDRFGGTICCGSNAIYRRAALDDIGGTVQIEHSEDAHTGFALADRGWIVRYVPLILAQGICPDDVHAYFHQQHRWCSGSMSLLTSHKFWQSGVPWYTKFCYICGFLFYVNSFVSILFSFQLFWTLIIYNQYINFTAGLVYYPYMLWSFSYLLWFPIMRFRRGCFYATFIQSYAYGHAVIAGFLRGTTGWIPTNTKQANVSKTFRQALWAASLYVFIYFLLFALSLRENAIHLLNFQYYSVQFWVFFNLVLSSFLLWQMYGVVDDAQTEQVAIGALTTAGLAKWKLRTACAYLALLTIVFMCIVYL